MPRDSVAVLDFGSEKLTVLIGDNGVNGTFNIKGVGQCDYAGFMNGDFLEPEELKVSLGEVIEKAEQNSHCKIDELYVGVPAEFSYCTCNSVSQSYPSRKKIKQKDIDELFERANEFKEYKSHTVITQSPIYFVLDNNKVNNPIGYETSVLGVCVSFILAENSFIERINGYIHDLDLKKVHYISSPYATAKYLLDQDIRDKYAILIDCGYITTSVSLVRGNGLLNMFSFSMGGGNITGDLTECLKIPFSSAEILKRKVVISIDADEKILYEVPTDDKPMPVSASTTNEIIKCRIEEIAKGINKCFASFSFEYPEFTPVYLTGGGLSYIKGGKDYLSKMIGKNIELVVPSDPQLNKPQFSTILGLLNEALIMDKPQKKGLSKMLNKIKSIFRK